MCASLLRPHGFNPTVNVPEKTSARSRHLSGLREDKSFGQPSPSHFGLTHFATPSVKILQRLPPKMWFRPNDAAFRNSQKENNLDENGCFRRGATRRARIVAENRRSRELLARPLLFNSVLLECKSRPALQLQRDERPGNPGRSVFSIRIPIAAQRGLVARNSLFVNRVWWWRIPGNSPFVPNVSGLRRRFPNSGRGN